MVVWIALLRTVPQHHVHAIRNIVHATVRVNGANGRVVRRLVALERSSNISLCPLKQLMAAVIVITTRVMRTVVVTAILRVVPWTAKVVGRSGVMNALKPAEQELFRDTSKFRVQRPLAVRLATSTMLMNKPVPVRRCCVPLIARVSGRNGNLARKRVVCQ